MLRKQFEETGEKLKTDKLEGNRAWKREVTEVYTVFLTFSLKTLVRLGGKVRGMG